MNYLDNAATTQVARQCADDVYNALQNCFANPSSLYNIGFEAQKLLEDARSRVAAGIGCSSDEVYFTASGTESNNLAMLGCARARKQWGKEIVVSGFEHPSVEQCVKALEREGFGVHRIMPGKNGLIDETDFLKNINKNTALASVMYVNNEIGTINNAKLLAERVKEINKRTAFHCDNVQGFMKQRPLKLDGAIDTMSVSAHKIHGPKGIGALYVRKGLNIANVIFGGLQEKGLRSGTENLAYAVGFAKAVDLLTEANPMEKLSRITELNQKLRELVCKLENVRINSPDTASPYILNFSLIGYRSETVLHFLEQREIYVSSGSACSKGEKSHTLSAMKLPSELIDSALRISFCESTQAWQIDELVQALKDAQSELVRI
ncbi:MAG: cysteine desulfurase family protein [Oscillospiraceae bacterium]